MDLVHFANTENTLTGSLDKAKTTDYTYSRILLSPSSSQKPTTNRRPTMNEQMIQTSNKQSELTIQFPTKASNFNICPKSVISMLFEIGKILVTSPLTMFYSREIVVICSLTTSTYGVKRYFHQDQKSNYYKHTEFVEHYNKSVRIIPPL